MMTTTTLAATEHNLNWCRLCRVCLTCRRNPRTLFQVGSCRCIERVLRHSAKDVARSWSTDFRFRRVSPEEVQGLQNLHMQIETGTPPIEPTLARANLCGTCQQRLRRAVDAAREPPATDGPVVTADFRRYRSIRSTIQERVARTARYAAASTASPLSSSDGQPLFSPDNSPALRMPPLVSTPEPAPLPGSATAPAIDALHKH
ncbi:hypothetical protein H4R19_007256, partial [Coemansia spiralis]